MMLLLMVLPALSLVVGLSLALSRRPVAHLTPDDADDLTAVRRRRTAARLLGPVLGVGVGLVLLDRGPGLGLALPVALLGGLLGLLVVVVVAELTVPGSRATVRTASLRPRRVGDLVAPGSVLVALTGVLTLVGLLVVGWAMGDPDDQGRAGRSLATVYRDAHGDLRGSAHGPWPGSFYAVPMLGMLVLAVALTGLALVVLARRPQPSARSADADLALRRGVAGVVVHALAAWSWLLVVPVAGLMSVALLGVDGAPGGYAGLGVLCLIVAPVAGGLGAWALGRMWVEPRVVTGPSRRGVPVVS